MSIISSIRQRARLLVGIMGVSLFFFIAQELIKMQGSHFNKTAIVGSIAGKKISMQDFQTQVESIQYSYLMTYRQPPSEEEMIYLRNHAWEKLVNDIIYPKICQSIGIQVTDDELIDMVQGEHIHPDIQAAFISSITKTFSKEDLLAALGNISKFPLESQQQWYRYEKALAKQRCQEKFQQLMEHSVFITSIEAQQQWILQNTVLDLAYIYIPYTQVDGTNFIIKNRMVKPFMKHHMDEYIVEENKQIQYIKFPILPSESDRIAFHDELEALKQAFVQTTEDKIFATTHTDAKSDMVTLKCTTENLPTELLPYKDHLKKGAVIGPVSVNSKCNRLYKVTNISSENDTNYEFNVLEKNLSCSDETKEMCLKEGEAFIKNVKTKTQFDTYKQKNPIALIEDAKVHKEDTRIGSLRHVRPLVHWIYNAGKVGKISSIFEIDDHYVIAIIMNHTKAGLVPSKQVKEEVKERMRNEYKTQLVSSKLQSLNLSSAELKEIAVQYGEEVKHNTAEKIRFDSSYLPTIGPISKAINKAFALEEGLRSTIIGDRSGIILLEVTKRSTQPLPDSWEKQQMNQRMLEQYKQAATLFKALTQPLNLQDDRYKYY